MKIGDWDIVTLGRLLAVGVVVVGVVLSALDASALGSSYGIAHYKISSFFAGSLNNIWLGGLLLALAEMAARFGRAEPTGRVDWNLTTLLRVFGVAVILGGISLTVWDARSGPRGLTSGFVIFSPNSVYSGSKRAITRSALEYAWRGSLLILAAEIADRLGWRGAAEEEPLIEPVQPLSSSLQP